MMNKSEKYCAAQIAPKESITACGGDYVKYITDDIIRELSKKFWKEQGSPMLL